MDDLGQFVVVDHREGQHELTTTVRTRSQQVGFRPDGGADARDHFFTNRIERRVGHLGEQLLEVIEQQPRTLRQHCDGRVGSHRTDRLDTRLGHRREDDLQLFVGVAEHLLTSQHAEVTVHHVLALGQIRQFDEPLGQPLGVGLRGGQLVLDLLVVDDATFGGVDQEHAPRLQTTLLHDLRLIDLDHTNFGGHHDDSVVEHPIATRTQPVAVEHRADHRAIGEGDARRAVPRLHERRVEPVERPLVGVHGLVVLPRFRNHHQDGVGQRTSAEVQQLEHFVETRRVAATHGADREGPLETRDEIALQQGLASAHPVAVALHGVDLAVVRDESIRMGQRPRGERVGGEPTVHQSQCALHSFVGQIGIERAQLRRGEHALVDERPTRERREVGALFGRQLVLDPLARNEHFPVEVDARGTGRIDDEQLPERRHHPTGARAEGRRVDGNLAPPGDLEPFFGHDRLDRPHR